MKTPYRNSFFACLLAISSVACQKEAALPITQTIGEIANDVLLATDTAAVSAYLTMGRALMQARTQADSGSYYNILGVTAELEGRYALALQYHQKSLAVRISAGIQDKVAKSHNNIAIVYRRKGDFWSASANYQKALALLNPVDKQWKAHIQRNYALAYQDHRDYAKARQMYQNALTYWKTVGNTEQIAMLQVDLGIINSLIGGRTEHARSGPIQGGDTHER